MHLVDAHRRRGPLGGLALRDPVVVFPLVGRAGDDRRRRRRQLGAERHRVGLFVPVPVGAEDPELVAGARADAGHEQLPDAGRAERAHRVPAPVPAVEVADHADAAGVRGPDRERRPLDDPVRRLVRPQVRAEHLPEPLVPSLADQVQVQLAHRGQPAVGVVGGRGVPVVVDLEPVVAGVLGHGDGEQRVNHRLHRVPVLARAQRDGLRPGHQRPGREALAHGVHAQHRVRVVVGPAEQPVDVRGRRGRGREAFGSRVHGVFPPLVIRAIEASGTPSQSGRFACS